MIEYILLVFGLVLPCIMGNMCLFFIIYKCTNNECIVDVAYAFSHLVAACVYAYASDLSDVEVGIKLSLIALWAFRLGGFLLVTRIFAGFHDPRYQSIFKNFEANTWKKDLMVFGQFVLQGFIVLVTSSTLYFLFNTNIEIFQGIFLGIALIGIILEGVADLQLEKFKANKQSPTDIMNTGLWKKSRHPNLFFDLVVWFSVALAGFDFQEPLHYLSLVGPIALFLVMALITVPLTERMMIKKRGDDYVEFQKRTNMFLPL